MNWYKNARSEWRDKYAPIVDLFISENQHIEKMLTDSVSSKGYCDSVARELA